MSQILSAALDPAVVLHTLADGSSGGGGGAPSVGGVLGNVRNQVKSIGLIIAGLMMVVLGIKVIVSMKGGQSLREAIQNLGVLGIGVAIIVSGAVITSMIQTLATTTIK